MKSTHDVLPASLSLSVPVPVSVPFSCLACPTPTPLLLPLLLPAYTHTHARTRTRTRTYEQDFVLTTRNYVRTVTSVRVEWLVELAPHYFDLANYPEGETKGELERAYRRLFEEKRRGIIN